MGYGNGYSNLGGYGIYFESTNLILLRGHSISPSEGDLLSIQTAINPFDGGWHFIYVLISRGGTHRIFIDNTERGTSTANMGRMTEPTLNTFVIGSDALPNRSYTGRIGESFVAKFTDVAASNFTTAMTNYYSRREFPTLTGGGAEVVFRCDFRGDSTTFLNDKSGVGNHLTGVNITLADDKKARRG